MLECMLLNLSALNKCSPRASSTYKLLSIQVMVESNALFDFAVILACATDATILLAQVVQKLDSAIHRINHYPADRYYGKQLRYPLDSDLSAG